VATADTIVRYAAGLIGPPALARGGPVAGGSPEFARMENLFELALSSHPMTGWEWDELTGYVAVTPHLVVLPQRLWSDLADRLLEETILADGLAWMQRLEALNRLLGHPSGAPAAIAACASLVADPTNQVCVEPVSILDASGHPDAARQVLDQLTHPVNERTRYGALLACVRKVRLGHFTPDQLGVLVPAVMQLLEAPEALDTAALGVEVLRRLPAKLRNDTRTGLRRVLGTDRILHEVLVAGRLAAVDTSTVVVGRIVRAIAAEVDTERLGFTDDLLPTLVDEVLFHPVFDVRLYAAALLDATPYRPALAAAFAAELSKPQVVGDVTLAVSLLHGLRVVGGPPERPLVERLVLAPGLALDVSAAAVESLGHVTGQSTDRFWLTAIALYGRGWRRRRSRHSAAALTGLVYGLGMARNVRLLARVRDDLEAPPPVRASARWWLNRPSYAYPRPRGHTDGNGSDR
jgi:hypothetical protein